MAYLAFLESMGHFRLFSARMGLTRQVARRDDAGTLHVSVAPKSLQTATTLFVLGPTRPLRDVGKLP